MTSDRDLERMVEELEDRKNRQENDLTSQYTDEERLDMNNYRNIINSNSVCTPERGEKWTHYADRVKIYSKIGADKNRLTHIDGPRKAWYTHRSPMGCFMCEDMNLIAVMRRVIGLMSLQYPDNKF